MHDDRRTGEILQTTAYADAVASMPTAPALQTWNFEVVIKEA
jgi:hypothetical protein